MFRKHKKKTEEDRNRSRSLGDILEGEVEERTVKMQKGKVDEAEWVEIASVSVVAPVVMCILPAYSADLVISAILAVGAIPLLTNDPSDINKDLFNCKVVVVDVSAPQDIIEAFIQCYSDTMIDGLSVVLVATQVGTNDRKKQLALRLIEECGPMLVTGRLADIYTLGQMVQERSDGSDSDRSSPFVEYEKAENVSSSARKASEPTLSVTHREKWKYREASSHPVMSISPRTSPRASPRVSPLASPVVSPRHVPAASPAGVRKKILGGGRKIGRARTLLPRVCMRGQFQDSSMLEVNVDDALEQGQALAAYTKATVHLYEMSLITNGEMVVEISKPQMAMKVLHSVLPSSAAVAAACVSSVAGETEELEGVALRQYSHGLALWYVAAEEACKHANRNGSILPGTLRQTLIDALSYLDEAQVRNKAKLKAYTIGKAT